MIDDHPPTEIWEIGFMVTVINRFDTLQGMSERNTPNHEYGNSVTLHIKVAWSQI